MTRFLLSVVAAGLLFGAAGAARAADWDGDGWDDGPLVYVAPRPLVVVPTYRVPVVAPIVRAPVATAARVVSPVRVIAPARVVTRVAPVRRTTRMVGRRVLLR